MFHWWFKKIKGSGTKEVKKGCTMIIDLLEQARMCWASWLCSWSCCHGFGRLLIIQFRRHDLVMETALLIPNRLWIMYTQENKRSWWAINQIGSVCGNYEANHMYALQDRQIMMTMDLSRTNTIKTKIPPFKIIDVMQKTEVLKSHISSF